MAESGTTILSREERRALADRLSDHADDIDNVAAHEMETDIRLAAAELRRTEDTAPLVPQLITEIRRIAMAADPYTKRGLLVLIGEAQ